MLALAALLLTLGAPLPQQPQPRPAAPETAAQFYLRYRAAALTAMAMDDILSFWTADTVHQFNLEPESVRTQTLEMMKRLYGATTGVRVVTHTPTAAGETLALEGLDADHKPVVASVDIVKEGDAWKVGPAVERWQPKRP
jgi:hypothetical protein